MIDNRFIESAKEIRKEFLKLSKELDDNRDVVTDLSEYLMSKAESIMEIRKELDKSSATKENIIEISKNLLNEMQEIEDKEKSMTKSINEINKKMEKLKAEEILLMKKIKEKYSNLTNEEIRSEVHSRL